jgi:hypothetical protein
MFAGELAGNTGKSIAEAEDRSGENESDMFHGLFSFK